MQVQKCIWDDFTNKYSLSKTLRFELRPVGKTLEYIKERGLIEVDKQREEEFNKIKKIMDEYYKEFIEIVLSNIEINLSDLKEYQTIYNKLIKDKSNLMLKKQYKHIQDKIRKQIYEIIKKTDNYNKLFGKELINDILPNWLGSKDRLADKELVMKFSKWATYFSGFFKNRENVFSEKPIPTSIIYRIVNDNLPKYLDNLIKFEAIKQLNNFSYSYMETELSTKLNNSSIDSFFILNNFNKHLTQKGVDLFNLVIGGYSENGIKKQGLNELIYLYSQKPENKEYSKMIRKLKMMPLFKQILSDKESFSDKFDTFINNEEVIKEITDYYTKIYSQWLPELKKLITDINNFDLTQIYINSSSISSISKKLCGDWETINKGLIEYAVNKLNLKTKAKKEAFLKNKYFSLYEIDESIKLLNLENPISICNYFSKFGESKTEQADLFKTVVNNYDSFKKIVLIDKHKFSEMDIEIIKSFLDSILGVIHFIKPIYINLNIKEEDNSQDAYETDADFYVRFNEIYMNNFNRIISIYNKTRNYTTKKPYSTKKFKLNFENSQLLNGWDANKEKDYYSLLFRKDDYYYLGIMAKGHNKIFENINNNQDIDSFEKIKCKLLPDPNKMLPKVFFSNSNIDYYKPSQEIKNIINYSTHTKGGIPKDGFEKKDFNLSDCHKLIDFYKSSLYKHPEWNCFNFKFKDTNLYHDISEFYDDISEQGYKLEFSKIRENYISDLVDSGKLYLFKIYNKDFSKNKAKKNKNSNPNLHTIYWREIFSKENLDNVRYQLNGGGEVFFREKSITSNKTIHPKKTTIDAKNPIKGKFKCTFDYDLIKDKRYTEDKFLFYCPITINFKAKGSGKDIHKQINEFISNTDKPVNVIGIDRGERHLVYYTLLDPNGDIIKSGSFNLVSDDLDRKFDYQDRLDTREKERDAARKSWQSIEPIKNLKEGYLSKVVHNISKLAIENNAIIVLEDLNFGFKKGRFKIEKQIYQKFEKMLIDKLNYLVFKDIPSTKIGGSLNGYQLTNKFESFSRLRKQSGILFYVNASYTSKIDPCSGFFNMILPNYESVEKSKELLKKFEYVRYNKNEDLFEFNFNFANFNKDIKLKKDNWSIYSNGTKLVNFRNKNKNNEWNTEEVNINEQLKVLFKIYNLDYMNSKNLMNSFNRIDSKDFFEQLIGLLKLILQLRNSRINTFNDYILSCVKDKNGHFFDSRTSGNNLPKNGDENGAYNIGLKGLIILDKIKKKEELKISKEEFVNYLIDKNM